MYLSEIYLENTGPISKCHVELPFNEGRPLPVVIVGPNGSGKTIFLSYIVDALIEFAKQAFHDTVFPDSSGGLPYFRIIHPRGIKSGHAFSLSLLHFSSNDDDTYYCEKSGVLDAAAYSTSVKSIFAPVWRWTKNDNHKEVIVNRKTIKAEMTDGAFAFFSASRHEDPAWLNPRSLNVNMDATANRRSNDNLHKPICVETCAKENISWILDVLFDASIDVNLIFLKSCRISVIIKVLLGLVHENAS